MLGSHVFSHRKGDTIVAYFTYLVTVLGVLLKIRGVSREAVKELPNADPTYFHRKGLGFTLLLAFEFFVTNMVLLPIMIGLAIVLHSGSDILAFVAAAIWLFCLIDMIINRWKPKPLWMTWPSRVLCSYGIYLSLVFLGVVPAHCML